MNTKTKKILGIALIAVIIAALIGVYFIFAEKPVEGSKEISIEVVSQDGSAKLYELQTDAEFLREAMDEAEGLTYSGEESEYGIMVFEVNGETASFSENGAYWGFNVNGEYCNYGIDKQPVNDGDAFSIVYTKG